METFLIALMVISGLGIIYSFYQLKRNKQVFKIRKKWINEEDERLYKFSYDYMMNPSEYNSYGLKYPKEEDFELN